MKLKRKIDQEIVDRAEKLYSGGIRDQLENAQIGLFLAIDLDSGDYEVGDARMPICDALRARRPDADIFIMRHGATTTGAIGFSPRRGESWSLVE